jgi:dolichol-phosphate hexosyltransferase
VEPRSDDRAVSNLRADIIIPTLNEEQTIGELLKGISRTHLPISLSPLVIDGGSSDKTVEICRDLGVRVIRQRGKGKGRAIRQGVESSDADIVVIIDGDGTYSLADLGRLVEPLLSDTADMTVGSRILGKREKGAISLLNRVGNKLFNAAINFALKSNVSDSLSGYRIFFRKTFMSFILFSDSFEIEVEMTVEALARGFRVVEVPISYTKRKGTSRTKLNPIEDGIQIGKTLMFILMNVNPLKFFGLLSLAFFIIGLYPGGLVLYEKISTGGIQSLPSVVFASLLYMSSGISLVIGILSELVVASRRRLETIITRTDR